MVLRFSPAHQHDDGAMADMDIDERGDWVAYDDYAELVEELLELREEVDRVHERLDDIRRIAR
ncbi:hypothetical protein [Burkholderia territorii]|uniref:hypothetical protein n=1 Tax=Burkholderia territorii TaxID=1503055 RepID=UPI000AAA969C|nr:hypothetical protein [Burkholderia territorii]